jgi:hypothetical protein
MILYLWAISNATFIKLFNQMTPFNGEKVRPRVTVKAGGKTFSWLLDTGASATCMNSTSFHAPFPSSKPRKIKDA